MRNLRVVLELDVPGRSECHEFGDIPVLDPAHIAVCAESVSMVSAATRLFDALVQALSAASNSGLCGGARLLKCAARLEPTCRSVLVAVTDTAPVSSGFAQLMRDWLVPPPDPVVVPVLPAGATPSVALPSPLDTLQVLALTGAPELLAADILRVARIGGREHRLFISYHRKDSERVADDLATGFDRRGFRVFLDRFRGTPGRAFPYELAEELADKGVVLVVESPNIAGSSWTLAEVAFAQLLRLGLFAFRMPCSPQFVNIRDRFDASSPYLWQSVSPRTLTPSAVKDVVEFVRANYAHQALRRRVYLEGQLRRAVGAAGLTPMGALYQTTSIGKPVTTYTLHVSGHPPRLQDARRTASALAAGPCHGVIVGPVNLLPPDDKADMRWLSARSNLSLVNEGDMLGLARRMAAGQVPI